jgi:hypothetical protein
MSTHVRPVIKRRVQVIPAPLPNAPVNRGAPPNWVTTRKYTMTVGNNRWKTYVHNNRRTGMRTEVRVAPGETLANTWRMNGFPEPRPMPGRFARLEEGEIYSRATRTLPMPGFSFPRAPPRAPARLLTPFPPLPPRANSNNQNKKNKAYIKSLVTRIIHKVTNQNSEDRKYIARLVGGIISKIKRQNANVPKLSLNKNATSRKRTNAGAFMSEILHNKAAKKAYANREGMTIAQVNRLLRAGLVEENNLNNALKAVKAARQQTHKPVNISIPNNLPALRQYKAPPRNEGLVLNTEIQHTKGAAGTGTVVMRPAVNTPNRAGRLDPLMASFRTLNPENVPSTAKPKNKKLTGTKARLAKKFK